MQITKHNSNEPARPSCLHEEICVVTETPTDGVHVQPDMVYVQCLLCNEVLPIRRIEQRKLNMPIYPSGKLSNTHE